jgi:hypothetical protein
VDDGTTEELARAEDEARERARRLWRPGERVAGAIGLAVAAVAGLVLGWGAIAAGWRRWLDWSRAGNNAAAAQATAAGLALAATVVLLGVTWWQARIARDAAARQLRQAREDSALAWDIADRERRLAQQAASDARWETKQGRRADQERTERAALPLLVWRDLTLVHEPGKGVHLIALRLSNVGAGPAVAARLYAGNGYPPRPVELGYFSVGAGEDMAVEVEIPAGSHGVAERHVRIPRQPHDVPGHFLGQLFAAYQDVYGNRFGSRVDVYWEATGQRYMLAPVIFLRTPDRELTIDCQRHAELRTPL